jgi:hypothetical protein
MPTWPYVGATLVLGWAGLAAYLAARHIEKHPEERVSARRRVDAVAARLEEAIFPSGGSHSPAAP